MLEKKSTIACMCGCEYMFRYIMSYRDIILTEAKPVLISPRSPKNELDCIRLPTSEPARAF